MNMTGVEGEEERDDAALLSSQSAEATDGSIDRRSEGGDTEKRLRRDLARAREQARSAVAERDAVVSTLQAESNERLIRSELQLRALQHGILDLDGLRLLDTRAISVGQDGNVLGAEEALASFRTSKPYLFNQGSLVVRPLTTTARENAPPRAEPEPVDARQLSREQWQVERARLLARRT